MYVSSGSANTIVVKANIDGNGYGADVDYQAIHYTQSHDGQGDDVITIASGLTGSSIDYEVTVPPAAHVQVTIDSGSVDVDGVSAVTIHTDNGNLDIEDVDGPVKVSTVNGDITARNIKGPLTMQTSSGSIRANGIDGAMKAITQYGDIIVQQATLSSPSILKTIYGSVRFSGTLDPAGTYTMQTYRGDVDLLLPATAVFQLLAHTDSGSIYNEFGSNTVHAAVRARIIVSIGSGSVAVSKAV